MKAEERERENHQENRVSKLRLFLFFFVLLLFSASPLALQFKQEGLGSKNGQPVSIFFTLSFFFFVSSASSSFSLVLRAHMNLDAFGIQPVDRIRRLAYPHQVRDLVLLQNLLLFLKRKK